MRQIKDYKVQWTAAVTSASHPVVHSVTASLAQTGLYVLVRSIRKNNVFFPHTSECPFVESGSFSLSLSRFFLSTEGALESSS